MIDFRKDVQNEVLGVRNYFVKYIIKLVILNKNIFVLWILVMYYIVVEFIKVFLNYMFNIYIQVYYLWNFEE